MLGPLLPAVPFGLALVGLLLPLRARRAAAALGITGAAAALLIAVLLALRLDTAFESSVEWISIGDLQVTFGVRIDRPAALVALAVGVVALAVQVYSVAYLSEDDRYPPYAAQVGLFTAAMLLVVVAGDLIMLLVGWEVMGICSYLLIGHDRRLPEAPRAAVKAFLVTRVGDVGFLLGIGLLGIAAGSFRIADVLAVVGAGEIDGAALTAAGLLLLVGVAGKSALFPLHTWLPDAMAGPTPISALIHAATMVAAGVYVVTRLDLVFLVADPARAVLAVLAAVTILLGGLAAMAQDDIKRVLAWSTVSQIGYMAAALAVGAADVALFHLITHAAFKALLFLAAGSVIHAVGTNSMAEMGGLRRRMPVTFWCMTIGLGALIGLPPLAGFWSKEAVLTAAAGTQGWTQWLLYGVGLLTVAVTAWYATRLWLRTFFGAPRSTPAEHAHEPPAAMAVPVLLLAVPSALVGLVIARGFVEWVTPHTARDWSAPVAEPGFTGVREMGHVDASTLVPITALVLGAVAAWLLWRREPAGDPARALGPLRPAFARAFWLDELQHALVVRPVRALARLVRRVDETVVDGAVEQTGRGTVGLGGALAALHRAGLPRAATAVATVALLIGLAAALGVLT
ncbi:NADH dehydrogenase subunit L [Micromonospora pattaloongensis]|uniref:NADH dehydrogenase subunit L n=1 Tax=Micromonospora pattaloongensis TaxID=405436 RepID=A0A1H3MQS4_9ACTN|nr:NADH-quinone oxidoreductase subunit L [Micromonospora pattaloongensis]SDY78535.1 NADH dehydrogenase subunit L [Micromonospora pattaloongensis]